jgi:ribonucleotide reductase alpha subunit
MTTKILHRLQSLTNSLSPHLSLPTLATSIIHGTYPNITTREIDILASETSASMSTQHFDYGRLAARICATYNHKETPESFSEAMLLLNEGGTGFVNNEIADLVRRRGKEIDAQIVHERDLDMTYFGFKTLERSYLLKLNEERIVERPQYLWMRVALGIHCCKGRSSDVVNIDDEGLAIQTTTKEEEDANLQAAFETYDLMSRGYFTHASPTLFHAGTTHPQLSSCFLVQMSDDSIHGIYDTLKRCAVISKVSSCLKNKSLRSSSDLCFIPFLRNPWHLIRSTIHKNS